MNVIDFAAVLLDSETRMEENGWYMGRASQRQGFWARFQRKGKWYWYSVSNTATAIGREQVAEAIQQGELQRSGPYGRNGWEATVHFGRHYYMLAKGNHLPYGL